MSKLSRMLPAVSLWVVLLVQPSCKQSEPVAPPRVQDDPSGPRSQSERPAEEQEKSESNDAIRKPVMYLQSAEPVNPQNLRIDTVYVTKVRSGRHIVGRLTIQGSRKIDFVKITVKPLGRNCKNTDNCIEEETSLQALELPVVPGGEYDVEVIPCASEARSESDDGNCSSEPYLTRIKLPSNSHVDAREKSLRAELEAYEQELEGYLTDLVKAAEKYDRDADACVVRRENAQAFAGKQILIGNFVQLGEKFITEAMSGELNFLDSLGDSLGLRGSSARSLRRFDDDSAKAFRENLELARDYLADHWQGFGLQSSPAESLERVLDQISPQPDVRTIDMLGGVIAQLGSARVIAEAEAPCLAEEALGNTYRSLNLNIERVSDRIADLSQQILELP